MRMSRHVSVGTTALLSHGPCPAPAGLRHEAWGFQPQGNDARWTARPEGALAAFSCVLSGRAAYRLTRDLGLKPKASRPCCFAAGHGSVKVRSGSRKTSGKRPNSCEFGYRERRCFGLLPAIRDFDGAVAAGEELTTDAGEPLP